MGFRGSDILWTVVGYGLVLGSAPLLILAPYGSLAACGVIGGVMGLRMALEGSQARGWRTAPGRVTRSEVVERTSQADLSQNVRAEISYVYEVDGRSYAGDRIGSGKPSGESLGLARRRVSRYPLGATVRVRYRPEDPGASLLEPGVPGVAWLLLSGWIFAGVAAYHWFERYGADPMKGWLDGVPLALVIGIPILSRLTREK